MKHVFQNSLDVMHEYVKRTNTHGRSSNVFFEKDKIYSYGRHYLLGEFINDNTIVINDKGYSITTAKHIRGLIAATRQYNQYFTTDIDLSLVASQIKHLLYILPKARKKAEYNLQIINKYEGLKSFLVEFNKTNCLESTEFKNLTAIYEGLVQNKDNFIKALQDAAKQAELKALNSTKERIAKFYNYEINHVYDNRLFDVLRLSQCRNFVQTSQGVNIPIVAAKMLFNAIKNNMDVVGYKIEGFTVIGKTSKLLTIGCHKIEMNEIYKIGQRLTDED